MKNTRRLVGCVALVAVCWAAGLGRVEAASGNADGTYTVTVTQVEVSKDGGSSYTTIFSGSQSINIASVDAGAVAAGLASGAQLDVGVYTIVRVTIGATLQLKGYVNNGATTIYTNGGSDTNGFSTNGAAANTPGSDYAVSSFTIPAANRTSSTTGLSMTVTVTTGPTVTVKFDTSGILTQAGGIPSVGAPVVTITSS